MPYTQLPDDFYCFEKQSADGYQRPITGHLDLHRWVTGNPKPWIKPSPAIIKKPKYIVISDWTFDTYSDEKQAQVCMIIEQLLEDGFQVGFAKELYIKPLKKPVTLPHKNAYIPDNLDAVRQQAIIQYGLTADTVHVLDDYWINHLIQDLKTPSQRIISVKEFAMVANSDTTDNLISLLQHAKPSVDAIVHDEFSATTPPTLALLHRSFPSARKLLPGYPYVVLDDSSLFKNQKSGLQRLAEGELVHHADKVLTRHDLQKTTQLHLSVPFTMDTEDESDEFVVPINITPLLQDTQSLTELTINDNEGHFSLDYPSSITINTTQLRSLTFHTWAEEQEKPTTSLCTLLFTTPAPLKKLDVSHDSLAYILTHHRESVTQLENLTLTGDQEEPEDSATLIPQLFETCLTLKKLFIIRANYTYEWTTLTKPHLNIEYITLAEIERIETYNIQILLQNTPNINELTILSCPHSKEIEEIAKRTKLQTLTIKSSNLNARHLYQYLSAAPNVQKLTFKDHDENETYYFNWTEFFALEPNITALKKLHIGKTDLNETELCILLQKTTQLTSLKITSCCNLADNIKTLKFPHLSLQKLTIKNTGFHSHFLDEFLNESPMLQKLILIQCTLDDDNHLLIEKNTLLQLTSVCILNSTLSAQTLKKLLQAAPNIHTLILDESCDDIIAEDPEIQEHLRLIPRVIRHSSPKETPNSPHTPIHDHESFKTYTPTPKTQRFQFQGINKTKNQKMLIEKLSQYIQLTQKYTDLFPTIQDGICDPLSHYFVKAPLFIAQLLENVVAWDGLVTTLTPSLEESFETIAQCITTHTNPSSHYLGDSLQAFIAHSDRSYCLGNPWHTIAIFHENDEHYVFYNPNATEGPQRLTRKDLFAAISTALGPLVAEITNKPTPIETTLLISNFYSFIEAGGLMALQCCDNKNAMLEQLEKLPHNQLTKNVLNSLLLRDTNGIPAWIEGLIDTDPKIKEITCYLLHHFILQHAPNANDMLQDSLPFVDIDDVKTAQQNIIPSLVDLQKASQSSPPLNNLGELLKNIIREKQYRQALTTWEPPKSDIMDLMTYCQTCFSDSDVKKRLIQCASEEDSNALQFALQAYCRNTNHRYINIRSPDELVCAAPFIHIEEGQTLGTLKPGPGGPLYNALTAPEDSEDSPLIVIVNYKEFKHDDLVQHSSLGDIEPRIDGTLLPKNSIIIGLMPMNQRDIYQGSDFYSRFNTVEPCPIDADTLKKALPTIPMVTSDVSTEEPYRINLYHSKDWLSRLLGRWTINGTDFIFEPGELQKAREHHATHIEIQNGLWHDYKFVLFWQEFFQNTPTETMDPFWEETLKELPPLIDIADLIADDETLLPSPPSGLQLSCSEGYDWDNLRKQIVPMNDSSETPWVALNPTGLRHFYGSYDITDTKKLMILDSIIKNAKTLKKTTLPILLSHTLSEDDWAMLLTECQSHHEDEPAITLQVACAPGISLPDVLKDKVTPILATTAPYTTIIQSNDIDASLLRLAIADATVIDISECTESDLLMYQTGKLDPETLRMEFEKKEGALITLLSAGKKVILKGQFSAELSQALTPLLLKRLQSPDSLLGELILLSEDTSAFSYLSQITHQVEEAEKRTYLGLTPDEPSTLPFASESLTTLRTRQKAIAEGGSDAWSGFHSIPLYSIPLNELDTTNSKKECDEYIKQRMTAVRKVLNDEPYVFLAGYSGVGKSTFVTHELCPKGTPLYHGVSKLTDWAKKKPAADEYITLFIDEATLDPSDWSLFEGLFATPPHILIDGTLYPLSPKHKVVFAGNPVSYGAERKLASLFQRHGNAVIFQPMTTAVIYEKILKPIFAETLLREQAADISHHLLEIYRFLCACETADVLISPRELEMMALLTIAHMNQYPAANPIDVAHYFAFQLAYPLVPPTYQQEFKDAFPIPHEPLQTSSFDTKPFLVTESRQKTQTLFNELLSLREQRQATEPGTRHDAWLYGGLGGLVLEGEPGIGKSELVTHLLRARGYSEAPDVNTPITENNVFYRMPVTLSIRQKRALLIKAFHEGAVVIVDELNSSPMIEQLLNELMMGFHNNERPKKPGFMIIGTQNPTTMTGRRKASTAFKRRTIPITLPPYSTDEMISILVQEKLSEKKARALVNAYEYNVAYARENHLTPTPTFRNLLNLAHKISKKAPQSTADQLIQNGIFSGKTERATLEDDMSPKRLRV